MKVHVDSRIYKRKPSKSAVSGIKKKFTDPESIQDLTVSEIAAALLEGRTVQPGVTPFSEESRAKGKNGTVADDFQEQTIFMVDIDNKHEDLPIETPEHAVKALLAYNLPVAFAYPTFSSTPEHERFRIALVCNEVITDKTERDSIVKAFIRFFPQADIECKNADRIFFGTDKGLYEGIGDMNATCTKADLLAFAIKQGSGTEAAQDNQGAKKQQDPLEKGGIVGAVCRAYTIQEMIESHLSDIYAPVPELPNRYTYMKGTTAAGLVIYQDKFAYSHHESDPAHNRTCNAFDLFRIHKFGYLGDKGSFDAAAAFFEEDEKVIEQKKEDAAEDFEGAEDGAKKKRGRRNPISHYTTLTQVYSETHTYMTGVQRLVKGGMGNDMVYEYEGGAWKARSAEQVKSELSAIVRRCGSMPDPTQVNKAYLNIVSMGKRFDVENFNSNENLVCFQNGVYRLSDGAKLEHSPEYYFTLQLDANIPETLQPTPYCDLCLSNFGGEDVQYLLLQIFGAAISNVIMSRFKKAVLLYGRGNSGKTQFKGLAERIVGAGNYNNVDLSDLENNRFLTAAFQGVRIGGSNDMSNIRIREERVFKLLTGGDSIQAEHKGEDGFTFRYKGLLWFLANQLPLFGGDKGKHVYDRWIVIPCRNSIPEEAQIKDLQDRMFEERDSFCIKALQALQAAVADNYTFAIPETCRLANEEYQRRNSSLQTFLDECCEPLNRDTCSREQTTGRFWQAFKSWGLDGGYYIPSKGEFKKEFAEIMGVGPDDLETHTKAGNFYPYVVKTDVLKEPGDLF